MRSQFTTRIAFSKWGPLLIMLIGFVLLFAFENSYLATLAFLCGMSLYHFYATEEVRCRSVMRAKIAIALEEEVRICHQNVDDIKTIIQDATKQLESSLDSMADIHRELVRAKDANSLTLSETALQSVQAGTSAIQFEDIVMQMARVLQLRLDHMQDLSKIIAPKEEDMSIKRASLDEISLQIDSVREAFENSAPVGVVKQTSMKEGDVELF